MILAGASWPFLFAPALVGAVAIVLTGAIYHRALTGAAYPARAA